MMMTTPVNSIMIPGRFVTVCENWHSGINCKLYAVSSTGNLTTGTRRPSGCNSDEQWYLTIWNELYSDIGYARRAAVMDSESDPACKGDAIILGEFEDWVDVVCAELSTEYGLDDWER